MASFQAPGAVPGADAGASAAPMVALFERDDEIAVPLLSQIRMAGYDVRAARTAVELFDVLAKNPVALVLIDLGGASASRREFWVALDARRRGRSLQVMTFRIQDAQHEFAGDEATVRALADIEVLGPADFPQIIEGIRVRVPVHGGNPGAAPVAIGTLPPGKKLPNDASAQFGQALGAMSTFMPAFSSRPPGQSATIYSEQPGGAPVSGGFSPFAQPVQGNPFSDLAPASSSGTLPRSSNGSSPFAQPLAANPFAGSPFAADPFTANPFAPPAGTPDASPFGGSDAGPSPSRHAPPDFGARSPLSPSTPSSFASSWSNPPGAGRSVPSQPGAGTGRGTVSQPGALGTSSPSGRSSSQPSIADRWTPPDQGASSADRAFEEQETSVAPEVAFQAPFQAPFQVPIPEQATGKVAAPANGWIERVQAAVAAGGMGGKPLSPADEQALTDVLVEGALLSPQTLEVLRGVQQMLSTVDMRLNVGELAMIFNFLSQDQYLAALLVSRGLVNPTQIASLGRVKQEMAAAGQDYDLGELLVKFKVLSPEQLARIQAEIGHR